MPCHVTAAMKAVGMDVTGVDSHPERGAAFIEKHGLDVHRCDIERDPLPFEDGTFQFVLFSEVFEHLRIDPLFTMAQTRRVMQPEGVLMLTTPNLYSGSTLIRMLRGKGINNPYQKFQKLHDLGHMGHIREYAKWEVLQMVQPLGFRVRKHWYRTWHREAGGAGSSWLVRPLRRVMPVLRPFQVFLLQRGA